MFGLISPKASKGEEPTKCAEEEYSKNKKLTCSQTVRPQSQSIHPSIHPSIHLSIYLFIYLSIYRSIDLSIYLSIWSCFSCLFLKFLGAWRCAKVNNLDGMIRYFWPTDGQARLGDEVARLSDADWLSEAIAISHLGVFAFFFGGASPNS